MANIEVVNSKAVGKRIREEREKLGLSREEFAEIIELSDYYVGQLERGERMMSLTVLVKIVASLHVDSDYLLFGKDDHENQLNEEKNIYITSSYSDKELTSLLNKCSQNELELVKKLIKTILPYINK